MKGPFSNISIGSVITLIAIFVTGIFLLAACLIVAIHRVQEGHVGVYYKNGALQNETTDPGVFFVNYASSLSRNKIEKIM